MNSTLRAVAGRRDLIAELVRADLRASTAQTVLGWLWWLLDPLIMMFIFWAIFEGLLQRGSGYSPYPLFLLCGLIPWKHGLTSVNASARVLRGGNALIKAVPFPTMILPLARVASGFAYFLFGMSVLLAAVAVWPNPQHSGDWLPLVQVLPLMVLQVGVIVGLCLILAPLGALLRDLELFIEYVMRAGFFLSPIFYGVDIVERRLPATWTAEQVTVAQSLYMVNPAATLISGYRHALFYGTWMPGKWWALLAVEAVVLLFVGVRVYQYYDRRVIKFL